MRKVVSESEVAHLWANQLQDEARKSNNSFYFNGYTIYSYGRHFPIATIDEQDNYIVYFTTRSYSNTTSGHKYTVERASSHKTKIYCKNPDEAARGYHANNIADFEATARNIAQKLPNSRKPEIYLNQIAQERSTLKKYAERFKLDLESVPTLAFIWIESKDGGTQATEQERKANELARIEREKNEAIRNAELLAKHKKDLIKWRSYKDNFSISRTQFYSRTGLDYLRFNHVTNRIETTQNVEIPLEIAKRFYKQVLETVASGKCEICGTEFMNKYEIRDVNKEFIRVGCHKITIKEIKALAKKMGW
jgi:hypothetical protein